VYLKLFLEPHRAPSKADSMQILSKHFSSLGFEGWKLLMWNLQLKTSCSWSFKQ